MNFGFDSYPVAIGNITFVPIRANRQGWTYGAHEKRQAAIILSERLNDVDLLLHDGNIAKGFSKVHL